MSRFLKWLAFCSFLAWAGHLLVTDAREQTRATQARAWYEQTQVNEATAEQEELRREWEEFKACVADGDKVKDCL